MTADEELRRALRVLHGMSSDLARAVLDGVKPDDIGQPDWEAANDDFRAALAARSEPQAEGLRCSECGQPVGYYHTDGQSGPPHAATPPADVWQPTGEYWRARALAAEAATPPAEGLDVERLARERA
jgi:hypothetical protein